MKQFINLEVELYQKYGLIGGCIVQFLQREENIFLGTVSDVYENVGIFSKKQITNALKVLEDSNVIDKKKVTAWYYEFTLNEKRERKKRAIPKAVQELMAKIEQDKKNKEQ